MLGFCFKLGGGLKAISSLSSTSTELHLCMTLSQRLLDPCGYQLEESLAGLTRCPQHWLNAHPDSQRLKSDVPHGAVLTHHPDGPPHP